MRFDEPPSEETLRQLIDRARGSGEETVTVETTGAAGDAWVRAGCNGLRAASGAQLT